MPCEPEYATLVYDGVDAKTVDTKLTGDNMRKFPGFPQGVFGTDILVSKKSFSGSSASFRLASASREGHTCTPSELKNLPKVVESVHTASESKPRLWHIPCCTMGERPLVTNVETVYRSPKTFKELASSEFLDMGLFQALEGTFEMVDEEKIGIAMPEVYPDLAYSMTGHNMVKLSSMLAAAYNPESNLAKDWRRAEGPEKELLDMVPDQGPFFWGKMASLGMEEHRVLSEECTRLALTITDVVRVLEKQRKKFLVMGVTAVISRRLEDRIRHLPFTTVGMGREQEGTRPLRLAKAGDLRVKVGMFRKDDNGRGGLAYGQDSVFQLWGHPDKSIRKKIKKACSSFYEGFEMLHKTLLDLNASSFARVKAALASATALKIQEACCIRDTQIAGKSPGPANTRTSVRSTRMTGSMNYDLLDRIANGDPPEPVSSDEEDPADDDYTVKAYPVGEARSRENLEDLRSAVKDVAWHEDLPHSSRDSLSFALESVRFADRSPIRPMTAGMDVESARVYAENSAECSLSDVRESDSMAKYIHDKVCIERALATSGKDWEDGVFLPNDADTFRFCFKNPLHREALGVGQGFNTADIDWAEDALANGNLDSREKLSGKFMEYKIRCIERGLAPASASVWATMSVQMMKRYSDGLGHEQMIALLDEDQREPEKKKLRDHLYGGDKVQAACRSAVGTFCRPIAALIAASEMIGGSDAAMDPGETATDASGCINPGIVGMAMTVLIVILISSVIIDILSRTLIRAQKDVRKMREESEELKKILGEGSTEFDSEEKTKNIHINKTKNRKVKFEEDLSIYAGILGEEDKDSSCGKEDKSNLTEEGSRSRHLRDTGCEEYTGPSIQELMACWNLVNLAMGKSYTPTLWEDMKMPPNFGVSRLAWVPEKDEKEEEGSPEKPLPACSQPSESHHSCEVEHILPAFLQSPLIGASGDDVVHSYGIARPVLSKTALSSCMVILALTCMMAPVNAESHMDDEAYAAILSWILSLSAVLIWGDDAETGYEVVTTQLYTWEGYMQILYVVVGGLVGLNLLVSMFDSRECAKVVRKYWTRATVVLIWSTANLILYAASETNGKSYEWIYYVLPFSLIGLTYYLFDLFQELVQKKAEPSRIDDALCYSGFKSAIPVMLAFALHSVHGLMHDRGWWRCNLRSADRLCTGVCGTPEAGNRCCSSEDIMTEYILNRKDSEWSCEWMPSIVLSLYGIICFSLHMSDHNVGMWIVLPAMIITMANAWKARDEENDLLMYVAFFWGWLFLFLVAHFLFLAVLASDWVEEETRDYVSRKTPAGLEKVGRRPVVRRSIATLLVMAMLGTCGATASEDAIQIQGQSTLGAPPGDQMYVLGSIEIVGGTISTGSQSCTSQIKWVPSGIYHAEEPESVGAMPFLPDVLAGGYLPSASELLSFAHYPTTEPNADRRMTCTAHESESPLFPLTEDICNTACSGNGIFVDPNAAAFAKQSSVLMSSDSCGKTMRGKDINQPLMPDYQLTPYMDCEEDGTVSGSPAEVNREIFLNPMTMLPVSKAVSTGTVNAPPRNGIYRQCTHRQLEFSPKTMSLNPPRCQISGQVELTKTPVCYGDVTLQSDRGTDAMGPRDSCISRRTETDCTSVPGCRWGTQICPMAKTEAECNSLNFEGAELGLAGDLNSPLHRCEWSSSEAKTKVFYMNDPSSNCMALPESEGFTSVSKAVCEGKKYSECYSTQGCYWIPSSVSATVTGVHTGVGTFISPAFARWGCKEGDAIEIAYGPDSDRKTFSITGFECQQRPVPNNLQCNVETPASEIDTFNSFQAYSQYLNTHYGDKMPDLHRADPGEGGNRPQADRECVANYFPDMSIVNSDIACAATDCMQARDYKSIDGYTNLITKGCVKTTDAYCSCTIQRTRKGYRSDATGEIIKETLVSSEQKKQAWVVYGNKKSQKDGLCIPDVRVTVGERMILYDVEDDEKLCRYGSIITCGGNEIHKAVVNEMASMSVPLKDMRGTSEQTCIIRVTVSGVPVSFYDVNEGNIKVQRSKFVMKANGECEWEFTGNIADDVSKAVQYTYKCTSTEEFTAWVAWAGLVLVALLFGGYVYTILKRVVDMLIFTSHAGKKTLEYSGRSCCCVLGVCCNQDTRDILGASITKEGAGSYLAIPRTFIRGVKMVYHNKDFRDGDLLEKAVRGRRKEREAWRKSRGLTVPLGVATLMMAFVPGMSEQACICTSGCDQWVGGEACGAEKITGVRNSRCVAQEQLEFTCTGVQNSETFTIEITDKVSINMKTRVEKRWSLDLDYIAPNGVFFYDAKAAYENGGRYGDVDMKEEYINPETEEPFTLGAWVTDAAGGKLYSRWQAQMFTQWRLTEEATRLKDEGIQGLGPGECKQSTEVEIAETYLHGTGYLCADGNGVYYTMGRTMAFDNSWTYAYSVGSRYAFAESDIKVINSGIVVEESKQALSLNNAMELLFVLEEARHGVSATVSIKMETDASEAVDTSLTRDSTKVFCYKEVPTCGTVRKLAGISEGQVLKVCKGKDDFEAAWSCEACLQDIRSVGNHTAQCSRKNSATRSDQCDDRNSKDECLSSGDCEWGPPKFESTGEPLYDEIACGQCRRGGSVRPVCGGDPPATDAECLSVHESHESCDKVCLQGCTYTSDPRDSERCEALSRDDCGNAESGGSGCRWAGAQGKNHPEACPGYGKDGTKIAVGEEGYNTCAYDASHDSGLLCFGNTQPEEASCYWPHYSTGVSYPSVGEGDGCPHGDSVEKGTLLSRSNACKEVLGCTYGIQAKDAFCDLADGAQEKTCSPTDGCNGLNYTDCTSGSGVNYQCVWNGARAAVAESCTPKASHPGANCSVGSCDTVSCDHTPALAAQPGICAPHNTPYCTVESGCPREESCVRGGGWEDDCNGITEESSCTSSNHGCVWKPAVAAQEFTQELGLTAHDALEFGKAAVCAPPDCEGVNVSSGSDSCIAIPGCRYKEAHSGQDCHEEFKKNSCWFRNKNDCVQNQCTWKDVSLGSCSAVDSSSLADVAECGGRKSASLCLKRVDGERKCTWADEPGECDAVVDERDGGCFPKCSGGPECSSITDEPTCTGASGCSWGELGDYEGVVLTAENCGGCPCTEGPYSGVCGTGCLSVEPQLEECFFRHAGSINCKGMEIGDCYATDGCEIIEKCRSNEGEGGQTHCVPTIGSGIDEYECKSREESEGLCSEGCISVTCENAMEQASECPSGCNQTAADFESDLNAKYGSTGFGMCVISGGTGTTEEALKDEEDEMFPVRCQTPEQLAYFNPYDPYLQNYAGNKNSGKAQPVIDLNGTRIPVSRLSCMYALPRVLTKEEARKNNVRGGFEFWQQLKSFTPEGEGLSSQQAMLAHAAGVAVKHHMPDHCGSKKQEINNNVDEIYVGEDYFCNLDDPCKRNYDKEFLENWCLYSQYDALNDGLNRVDPVKYDGGTYQASGWCNLSSMIGRITRNQARCQLAPCSIVELSDDKKDANDSPFREITYEDLVGGVLKPSEVSCGTDMRSWASREIANHAVNWENSNVLLQIKNVEGMYWDGTTGLRTGGDMLQTVAALVDMNPNPVDTTSLTLDVTGLQLDVVEVLARGLEIRGFQAANDSCTHGHKEIAINVSIGVASDGVKGRFQMQVVNMNNEPISESDTYVISTGAAWYRVELHDPAEKVCVHVKELSTDTKIPKCKRVDLGKRCEQFTPTHWEDDGGTVHGGGASRKWSARACRNDSAVNRAPLDIPSCDKVIAGAKPKDPRKANALDDVWDWLGEAAKSVGRMIKAGAQVVGQGISAVWGAGAGFIHWIIDKLGWVVLFIIVVIALMGFTWIFDLIRPLCCCKKIETDPKQLEKMGTAEIIWNSTKHHLRNGIAVRPPKAYKEELDYGEGKTNPYVAKVKKYSGPVGGFLSIFVISLIDWEHFDEWVIIELVIWSFLLQFVGPFYYFSGAAKPGSGGKMNKGKMKTARIFGKASYYIHYLDRHTPHCFCNLSAIHKFLLSFITIWFRFEWTFWVYVIVAILTVDAFAGMVLDWYDPRMMTAVGNKMFKAFRGGWSSIGSADERVTLIKTGISWILIGYIAIYNAINQCSEIKDEKCDANGWWILREE